MPYIKQDKRDFMNDAICVLSNSIDTPGDLNYAITELARRYLVMRGVTYTTLNTLIGVLECAKQEFYRRAAVPYEDQKASENGDVYGPG